MNAPLVLLLAYCAAMVAVGVVVGRGVQNAATFFVAGRRLSPSLLFATVMAANIGAGSTVGAAGLGYRDGLSAWWWVGSAGAGTLVLAWWIGPRMWRIAREHDLRTMGDFLEWRYGPSVRASVSVLLWFGTLAILAGQLIAMAAVLEAVAGIPKLAGCLLGGLVMISYFVAGGLLSSTWVNLVQLVVLLAGFLVAVPLAVEAGGGWTALRAAPPEVPGLVQKVYGARDERAVRRGLGWCGLALMAFAALPPILGIVARVLHPGLERLDLALPTLLVADLPVAVGMLGLAAVFSAEISSADAILFMLATSLSQDLYRRFMDPRATDARILAVARWAAAAGGLLGIALAAGLPSVIASLTIFYSLLSGSLLVPVVLGLHSRRAGVAEALAAIAGGTLVLLTVRQLTGGAGWGLASPTLCGLVASALAGAVGLAIRSRRATLAFPGR